jgi:hypothetical protein
MSIDKDTFAAGMTALSGAFGREIDGAVTRMYFGILSPKLTTDEFQQAVKETLETETFWPAPAVILGKVARLKQNAGDLAFAHVNKITSEHGGFRYLSYDTYQREFDVPTKAAIAAVGGLAKIANTSEEHWPGLAKRFAAAHQEATAGRPSIERVDVKALAAGE